MMITQCTVTLHTLYKFKPPFPSGCTMLLIENIECTKESHENFIR